MFSTKAFDFRQLIALAIFTYLIIVDYLKYLPYLSQIENLHEITNNLTEKDLKIANKIFYFLRKISLDFSKRVGFEWDNPELSYLILFFLGDKDLVGLFSV